MPLDRAGRVIVGADLTIPGHPEVFVAGDMAAATSADTGRPVPGVAQGGIQMGHFAGRTIAREVEGGSSPTARAPFVYHDKGSLAVIGKAKAVAQIGRIQVGGFLAWLLWCVAHIYFLIGFRNRAIVALHWAWNYITFQRGTRLITGLSGSRIKDLTPGETKSSPPMRGAAIRW